MGFSPTTNFWAEAQLQNFGLKPNYKLLGFSPTTNFWALAQLQTFGLKFISDNFGDH
ncbi:MAG: hypothetical protein MUC60_15450 [Oscillatoria sp. Prado101]|nr:hypothetical protein [Oscillatoria sp. Prado101]